ncbi:hypothetical protein [Paraburkholderia sp.]|uniref:hypothetical protein n=1 Tax=Paraburkholderia sp. TaxID=1926495 RepID=UPI002AFE4121|nr:hypothetical protein [Paraburkholderia sp.]
MWRTRSVEERAFYEAEALRRGWSVRQLDRQPVSHSGNAVEKQDRHATEVGQDATGRSRDRRGAYLVQPLHGPAHHHRADFADRALGIKSFGSHIHAVHDGAAAV